ncbi:MAG: UbiA family prenyltransferase [Candidatus Dormibacteraeota bacterium]|nr:UbiA family prenyltransferase [Candidatus Dormibacteraeota bacterium]
MILRTTSALARSCHPEPTLAVTAFLTILALRAGRGTSTIWVALAVLFGQLSVGWANDYLDRSLDRGRPDKPIAAGEIAATAVRAAAVVALVLAVLLSLLSGLLATAAHVIALALAHAYNLWLKRTAASVLAYAAAFALAPAFVALGARPPRLPPGWLLLAAALLGAGAHFTQTLADHDRDRDAGIRGLPQRMGRRASVLAAALLLAVAALLATLGPGHPSALAVALFAVSVALVAGTVATGLAGRYRASFRLTLGAAAAAVLVFLVGSGGGVG